MLTYAGNPHSLAGLQDNTKHRLLQVDICDAAPKCQAFTDFPTWAEPVWHLFVIRHPLRDTSQKHLADLGIQTIIHYPIQPHLCCAYTSFSGIRLPLAEQFANEVLSLPIGPHMSPAAVSVVVDASNRSQAFESTFRFSF